MAGGRKKYEPTDKDLRVVETMAGCGMPQEAISRALGIDGKTLRKHFRSALDSSADKADAQALKKCRDTTIAGVRPLCEVIQDFKNQCVAVAMDPQAGTPGVGWSVAPDLHTAEAQALSKCESTAGPGRRAACAVDHSSCDGSAK